MSILSMSILMMPALNVLGRFVLVPTAPVLIMSTQNRLALMRPMEFFA